MEIGDNTSNNYLLNETFFIKNPIPMWVYDLATLRFLEVNEAATIIYGYTREEFLSMTIKDIRPSEDLPNLFKVATLENEGFADAGIWRHIKKNGELIFVNISSQVIEFQGKKAELILSLDQTERVKVFQELKNNESKLNSILNSVKEVIWSSDPINFEINFINKNVKDLYGYEAEDFYRNSNFWSECILEEDRERVMKSFSKIRESNHYEEEYRIRTKDNKIKWLKDKAWYVKNENDEIIRIDGIIREITEEKENLQKIKELSDNTNKQNLVLRELAFINSHKIRGPLVSILAGLELLTLENNDEIIIQKIKKAGEELDLVIKNSMNLLSDQELKFSTIFSPQKKEIQTVFAIDDDQLQILTNKILIQKINSNFNILIFDNPKEALDAIVIEDPQLVFLDLNMPEMSGWDFLDELEKNKINLDVYILTSSADPYDKKKAEHYENVKGFLTKPLSKQTLLPILN
ncbi:MAG: PAS domain-containing protein [Leptospiraceae bacterium]|nr:PAS domain-containing protein [Leptospiraceae bacterium]